MSDNLEMAEILSAQYQSVFTTPMYSNLEEALRDFPDTVSPVGDTLSEINITENKVRTAVSKLSFNASAGPDGVPASVIKNGGEFVISALTDIFQQSLDEEVVPQSMKEAFVPPIWKGSDRTSPANYRPISLTTHYSKLLERIIRPEILEHMTCTGAIDDTQHGALGGRSTVSQLLLQYDLTLRLLEDGGHVDIVYLDFSKAFDKVDILRLLAKVAALGITGKLFSWIKRFLIGRKQAVRVGDRVSKWAEIISGVPQGSVLGPLLFLIYIGDMGLTGATIANLFKFVNDTKLIGGSKCLDDIELFQDQLNGIYTWQKENNMLWNDDKFQLIRLRSSDELAHSTLIFTPDFSNPIPEQESVRDLGIQVDNQATFKAQRSAIISKTNAKAGWVLRTIRSREPGIMKTLWRSVIQSKQDYGSQVWSPANLPGDLLAQEGPLRTFSRKVRGLESKNYWQRLKSLGLQSTQRRNERYKILYTWKSLKGIVPDFGLVPTLSMGRNGGLRCKIPDVTGTKERIQTLRENSLVTEGPRLFNSLPKQLRDTTMSLESFKSRLDTLLALIPDQPMTETLTPDPTNRTGRRSNSIRDWIPFLGLMDWFHELNSKTKSPPWDARS